MKIKAAVLREHGKGYKIEELELEDPKQSEVLIKYAFTGYCHSDLSIMKGHIKMPLPMVAGHEVAGVVEAVGPGVTLVKKGDHVASTWMIPCGHCPTCRSGMGNLCLTSFDVFAQGTMLDGTPRMRDAKGAPVLHGAFVAGFSSHAVMPETGVVPLPKDFPLEHAALMSCCIPTGWGAVHKVADVRLGDRVAVWGLGGIGLNIIRAARMRQAYPIIAIDLEKSREKLARELGATHFICNADVDPVPVIKDLTNDRGIDFAFDAVGDPGVIEQAWWALAMNGTIVLIGIMGDEQKVNMSLQLSPFHHKDMIGGLYGGISTHDDIPKLTNAAMRGDLLLEKLVSGTFKIEEVNDIAERMEKRQLTGRWLCEWR